MTISSRREREKQEMRQLIVDAAIDMYLKEGYEKLSLRGIAQRIEYAPGTIYLYFKDKHELFHAMHEWAFQQLFERFSQLTAIPDPYERLLRIGHVYVDFAMENPELYDLMFILNEPMCADANLEEWPCGQKTYHILQSTVEECIGQGLLVDRDAPMVAFQLWSAVHGMVSLYLRNRLRMYEQFDIRQLVRLAMEGLYARFRA